MGQRGSCGAGSQRPIGPIGWGCRRDQYLLSSSLSARVCARRPSRASVVVKAQKAEFGRVAAAAMAATTLMAGVSTKPHSVGMSRTFGQRGEDDGGSGSSGEHLGERDIAEHWSLDAAIQPTSMLPPCHQHEDQGQPTDLSRAVCALMMLAGCQRPHLRRAAGPDLPAGQGLRRCQHLPRDRGRLLQPEGARSGDQLVRCESAGRGTRESVGTSRAISVCGRLRSCARLL